MGFYTGNGGLIGPGQISTPTGIHNLNANFLYGQIPFNANVSAGFNGFTKDIVFQPDGKILVCGQFTTYNGSSATGIVRLNRDGTRDTTFTSGAPSNVESMRLLSDGKILIGDSNNTWSGTSRGRGFARINSDGSLDGSGFNANVGTGVLSGSTVYAIATQSSGKIILGGDFSSFSGITSNRMVSIQTNGAPLQFGSGSFNTLDDVTIDSSDGVIFSNHSSNRLARYDQFGNFDNTFSANLGTGFNGGVVKCIRQSDGKLVVVGSFTTLNGNTANRIARLNSNGTVDVSFSGLTTGANASVYSAYILSNGKILVVGDFTTFNSVSRNRIVRLNSDGSLDTTFVTTGSFNSALWDLTVDSANNIYVVGFFTTFNGITRNRIIKFLPDGQVAP